MPPVDAQFAECYGEEVHNAFATDRNDFESLLPRENISRKRCITWCETARIRSRQIRHLIVMENKNVDITYVYFLVEVLGKL